MKGPIYRLRFVATALLFLLGSAPVFAQQRQDQDQRHLGGLVEDWTHHHAIFSNPGREEDAIAKGKHEDWRRIVNNRRYLMQQIRRGRMWPGWKKEPQDTEAPMQRDWTVSVGDVGVAPTAYPAKYTFAPIATPSCTNDFVVYPLDVAGSTGFLGIGAQANIIGVNNLYKTTCTGTVPTVAFAYYVGTGVVQTSPVLSEDGTKVAFVESVTGGSNFHVLKLGTTGSNGTAYTSPATPGTSNNAVDNKIAMSGGVSVTRSSPFVDYERDIAYVGDDTGHLHKFTPVFQGTPAEVTTGGWPIAVDPTNSPMLTGPVFDNGSSQDIFVGGSYGTANGGAGTGKIYCITLAGAACSTPSLLVGTGVVDAPIVDSTEETVFVTAYNAGPNNDIVVQAPVSLASSVTVTLGDSFSAMVDGAFDNAYYTSPGTGHLYVCGDGASGAANARNSVLYRVGFNSSGTMNSTNDGNSYTLTTGTINNCSPLTEIYNGSTDYLFLSEPNDGAPSGCGGGGCVMSFNITSAFPTAPIATLSIAGVLGVSGDATSGIIIDNVSTVTGASQIYYVNPNAETGVQASQAGLQ
jgi:hypothetical protein